MLQIKPSCVFTWQVSCGGPSFRQQDFNQWRLQCNRSAPRRARLQHRWELILSVSSFLHIYQFSLLFSHCLLLPPFVLRYQHVEFGGVSHALLQTSCRTQHAESDRHREARAEWQRPSSLHRAGVRWVRLLRDLLQRHTEVHIGGSWRQVMGSSEKFKDYSFFLSSNRWRMMLWPPSVFVSTVLSICLSLHVI